VRFIATVSTKEKTLEEIRKQVIEKVDELIKKLARACSECKKSYIPERRKRRKYCSDKCRWIVSNRSAMDRYYARKKKKEGGKQHANRTRKV
jgi:endogenous inhibitor of DNA gyrase (YacG/DUF329 family)